jgi:bifunctional DNA primase/polymerase-like protein/primase-like protein
MSNKKAAPMRKHQARQIGGKLDEQGERYAPTKNQKKVLQAALSYAARGWHVFPAPPGEKKSYKSATFSGGRPWGATTDEKQIRRDFTSWYWPHANVGIVTGPLSGIFVVDIDTPEGHDVDGFASLRALERKHGRLPPTLMAESPSGSRHYYFNYPADVTIKSSTSIARGIDLPGMVIAPPSVTPKGRYRWLNDNPITDAPVWLIKLATADDQREHKPGAILMARCLDELTAAVEAIPNDFNTYNDWKKFALAIAGATGGDDYGFELLDKFSRRWTGGEYNEANTRKAWRQVTISSPPNRIGAGTIFLLANKANPHWRAEYEKQLWTRLVTEMLRRKNPKP